MAPVHPQHRFPGGTLACHRYARLTHCARRRAETPAEQASTAPGSEQQGAAAASSTPAASADPATSAAVQSAQQAAAGEGSQGDLTELGGADDDADLEGLDQVLADGFEEMTMDRGECGTCHGVRAGSGEWHCLS